MNKCAIKICSTIFYFLLNNHESFHSASVSGRDSIDACFLWNMFFSFHVKTTPEKLLNITFFLKCADLQLKNYISSI